MTNETKEVAVVGNGNKALVEAHVDNRGYESAKADDMLLGSIVLLQDNSKLRKYKDADGHDQKHDSGLFINTLTGKTHVSFNFVPVGYQKYYDLLSDDPDRPEFQARVFKEDDPRLVGRRYFPKDGHKANVNTVMSYIVIVDGSPAKLSFSKTAYNTGKKLMTLLKMSKKAIFAQTYTLTAKENSGKKGTFFNPDVTFASVTEGDALTEAENFFASTASMKEEVVPF